MGRGVILREGGIGEKGDIERRAVFRKGAVLGEEGVSQVYSDIYSQRFSSYQWRGSSHSHYSDC